MPVTARDHDDEYLTLHTNQGMEITQDDIPRILLDAAMALPPDEQPDITNLSRWADVRDCPGNVRLEILYQAQKYWYPGDDTESSNWNRERVDQARWLVDNHLGILVENPGPKYLTYRNGRYAAGAELWRTVADGSRHLLPERRSEPHTDDPVLVLRERHEGNWQIIRVILLPDQNLHSDLFKK